MIEEKRIAFMGSPAMAVDYIDALLKNKFNLVAIYSQPPRPQGRGMKPKPTPVQIFAEKNQLPIFTPINLNTQEEMSRFKNLKIDLIIVMGYGKLIPKFYLNQNSLGCINIHVSLLPKWRGAAPIEYAILAGDRQTGVTIFKLSEKIDAGPILNSKSCVIAESMTKIDLQKKLNKIGTKLLIKTLPMYLNNQLKLKEQDQYKISYAHKITSKNTQINFFKSAKEIYNQVRAFSPKPGAWFLLNDERIKILSCSIKLQKGEQSTILSKKFLIGCKDKSIQPIIIQRAGKQPMKTEDLLRGYSITVGKIIRYHAKI